MKRTTLACLALAVSGVLCFRAALAEVDESTALSVIRETVLWDALTTIPAGVREDIEILLGATHGEDSAAAVAAVIRSSEVAFTTDRARASALRVMREGLDDSTVAEVTRWTDTSLGQRLLAHERAQAVPHAWKFPMSISHVAPPMDVVRLRLLTDIVDGRMVLDGMAEISVGTNIAVRRGLSAVAGTEYLPESAVRSRHSQLVTARRQQQYSASPIPGFSMIYASFTADELQQYINYLGSAASRKLNELVLSAIREILIDADIAYSRDLVAFTNTADG